MPLHFESIFYSGLLFGLFRLHVALHRAMARVFLGSAVLVVVYMISDTSVLECVTGWRSSAAYRSDVATGSAIGYGVVFVGGLGFGLSLVRFTYTGLCGRLIAPPGTAAGPARQPGLAPRSAPADGLTKKMIAGLMMLLAFGASLSINIAYVVVRTSTFFTTPFKAGWIVIFAVVHELLDHLVYPLVVLAMCRTMKSVTHLAQVCAPRACRCPMRYVNARRRCVLRAAGIFKCILTFWTGRHMICTYI